MELQQKLAILADAAKYDASCASSGSEQKDSKNGKGIGSTGGVGICHSYAPDGRCISLLKILLTNFCVYECSYCVNRKSSNTPRARFTAKEVVTLTLDFYKRNYIEGLFLSSGIIQSPDYTMEQVVEVARSLREDHDFRGYIHLKTIPDADPEILARAGLYADRLSINVELPTSESLKQLAPEKSEHRIKISMAGLRSRIDEAKVERKVSKKAPKFAPAGQSTQMIIGADTTTDSTILERSSVLYRSYGLRRVYYSAFSPIPDASSALPLKSPPLIREHRLYQADWLFRFYGFEPTEIASTTTASGGMLDLDIDPKLAWAIANPESFPVNINKASKRMLLRVPGLGPRNVRRILDIRRQHRLRLDDLLQLRVSLPKVMPFVETLDHCPGKELESDNLRARFAPPPQQADMFAA